MLSTSHPYPVVFALISRDDLSFPKELSLSLRPDKIEGMEHEVVDYEEDFYFGNSSAVADTHTNMLDG